MIDATPSAASPLAMILASRSNSTATAASRAARSATLADAIEACTDEIAAIEQQYGVRLAKGRYWYDRACGAWGIEGGPTVGFVMPGLAVGGPLRADSSGGNTRSSSTGGAWA